MRKHIVKLEGLLTVFGRIILDTLIGLAAFMVAIGLLGIIAFLIKNYAWLLLGLLFLLIFYLTGVMIRDVFFESEDEE